MSQSSKQHEQSITLLEHKLQQLLRIHNLKQEPNIRQQQILQGVRWLATLQELLRLYCYFLPKVLFDLLQHLIHHPTQKD